MLLPTPETVDDAYLKLKLIACFLVQRLKSHQHPLMMKPTRVTSQASAASCTAAATSQPPLAQFSRLVSGECKEPAKQYGDCVNARYKEVEMDMCKAEFMAFKACAHKVVSRSWTPFII
ncbi:hypothetical protein DFH28DRAFT_923982 [Melampsora americana]|nr:hypothetical protein DFH28DRAFT_923982 [Melampsora americana]